MPLDVAAEVKYLMRRVAEVIAEGPIDGGTSDDVLLTSRITQMSLPQIREALGDCERCGLCEHRKSERADSRKKLEAKYRSIGNETPIIDESDLDGNIVFGTGNPNAKLMIIGEAPGKHEDHYSEPFVGASGDKLTGMLKYVEIDRADVYITNLVKCRPPGNRDPNPGEIDACVEFLTAQVASVKPDVILLLGSVALKSLMGLTSGVSKNHGTWMKWKGIDVIATFHPSAVLRHPELTSSAAEDLRAMKKKLDEEVQ